MKILFMSDFVHGEVDGGAERANNQIVAHLRKTMSVAVAPCREAPTIDYGDYDFVLISNRVSLPPSEHEKLLATRYALIEHDCQFVRTRNVGHYPDMVAPPRDVVNRELYENAQAVFLMSELHQEAFLKNIKGANAVNLGGSFWSDEEYAFMEEVWKTPPQRGHEEFLVDFSNPVKGAAAAKRARPQAKILPEMPWEDFIQNLFSHRTIVFVPQVFETFSRLCAEAKMCGCKVATRPKSVGFFSESVFDNLSGLTLIQVMKERQEEALKKIHEVVVSEEDVVLEDVTVVLNVYRRPHLIDEQIDKIKSMTVRPKEIFVWVNDHVDNHGFEVSRRHADVITFRSSRNWKYHGRFAAAMLAETEYVAFFDDDTMPAPGWFDICFGQEGKKLLEKGEILGGVGILLKTDNYREHERVGWPTRNKGWERVDLVGHAWVMAKSTLSHFWEEEMLTTETGEDIHLSYCASKHGKGTWVPPLSAYRNLCSTKGYELGVDEVASSHPKRHADFYRLRDEMVKEYKKRGWKR